MVVDDGVVVEDPINWLTDGVVVEDTILSTTPVSQPPQPGSDHYPVMKWVW